MKKLLTYLAVIATVFVFTPNVAEARGHSHGTSTYVSGYSSCGCPIYTQKFFRYNDRYGRPIYGYRTLPSQCRGACKKSRSHRSYNKVRSYGPSRGYYKRGHYNRKSYNRGCSNNSYRYSSRGHSRSGFRVTYRR